MSKARIKGPRRRRDDVVFAMLELRFSWHERLKLFFGGVAALDVIAKPNKNPTKAGEIQAGLLLRPWWWVRLWDKITARKGAIELEE